MKAVEIVRRMPWTIVFCVAGLIAIGLSGIARGDELAGRGNYFGRQLVWVFLAGPAMFAVSVVPYRTLRWSSYPLFGLSVVLLALVYAMPVRQGAQRWIPLGIMDFQPSEMAKLAYMMALAQYLMHRKNYRRLTGLLVPFAITVVPVVLILREPDLGTALVFFPVLFAMLFAAGARPRHLALVGAVGAALTPVLWMGMSPEQQSRIVTLFVQRDGGPAPKGDGYHLHQSKQVLALGGIWGSEFDDMPLDDPVAYHLPAARTDFIFCLIGERWGLVGCSAVLLLYVLLFARGLAVAAATREPFGRLMAVGVVALVATQAAINAGMTVGLMPITGLTLPLVSYGGSSLLATCIAAGLLLSIAIRPGYEISPEPFRFSAE